MRSCRSVWRIRWASPAVEEILGFNLARMVPRGERDEHRVRIGWTLTGLAISLVIVIGTFAATDRGRINATCLMVVLLPGILVGFAGRDAGHTARGPAPRMLSTG